MPIKNQIQKIVDPKTFDLSKGVNELISGIRLQYPELSVSEIKVFANSLLEQAGKALAEGKKLASVDLKSNGDFDIDIWHIGPKKRG